MRHCSARETSREIADMLADDFHQPPQFEVTVVHTPPETDARYVSYVATQFPEVWGALRAEEQRISERIAAAAGGWAESPIAYRLPTDVLDLVDAVALCREYHLEVIVKSAPGDATLMRVITRPLVRTSDCVEAP